MTRGCGENSEFERKPLDQPLRSNKIYRLTFGYGIFTGFNFVGIRCSIDYSQLYSPRKIETMKSRLVQISLG